MLWCLLRKVKESNMNVMNANTGTYLSHFKKENKMYLCMCFTLGFSSSISQFTKFTSVLLCFSKVPVLSWSRNMWESTLRVRSE